MHHQSAAEHLRVIRSLMERATVYRAISAPAALAGALLALALATLLAWESEKEVAPAEFVLLWILVLAVASAVNFTLLWKDSVRRGDSFVSPGMRLALRSILPPMLAGGVLGIGQALAHGNLGYCAILWILCYGLALCATAGFAPKSIKRLGGAFLIAGLLLAIAWHAGAFSHWSQVSAASIFMGTTFGLLHLVYALCVGLRAEAPAADPAVHHDA